VRFLDGCTVTGLLTDPDRTTVTGVRIRRRQPDGASSEDESLMADLVVDASGRNSRTPEWLQALGYTPPEETSINAFLGYASRWYQRPPGFQADWKVLILFAQAPHIPSGGMIYPVEGERWIVTLAGTARNYPPTDEAGFLEFARHLAIPDIYDAIKDARPLTPIYGYQRTENHLRHYERLSRWPEHFGVLGDAVCAFNPVYGQGMTVSALGALVLDRCLRRQRQHHSDGNQQGLGQQFQRQLAEVNATPWLMATGEDFRWPTTEGGRPDRMTRFMHRYLDQVVRATGTSTAVSLTFWEVTHLLKPPGALFHPRVLVRVLAQWVHPNRPARHPLGKNEQNL
jgi:2-polyprenyl-6-methoxyphenol hydroxylase-like FAD-dependent oxidoreductase